MSDDTKYVSRQHTMKLNMCEHNSSRGFTEGLSRTVQCVRDIAFQRADDRVRKLENETGKQAIDRLTFEKFTTSQGKPALTVRIEFILVDRK